MNGISTQIEAVLDKRLGRGVYKGNGRLQIEKAFGDWGSHAKALQEVVISENFNII